MIKKDQIYGPVEIKYAEDALFGCQSKSKFGDKAFIPSYITQRTWVYLLLPLLEDAKGIVISCRSEFYNSIAYNDVITYKGVISDIWEKRGKYFFKFSYNATNQKDEIVAKHELTFRTQQNFY